MSTRRTVVSAALAWVVVVALGSTAVWTVISRAGQGIAPSSEPVVQATPTGPSAGATTAPGSAGPQRRTWQGVGGFVTADCRGTRITLVAKSADPGFVVEERDEQPGEIRVTFEGQGDEVRETEVRGHCEGGVPVFGVTAGERD